MIGIVADDRFAKRHKTTLFECVKDAKSAVRRIRANAGRLGIEPNRIAVGGGSDRDDREYTGPSANVRPVLERLRALTTASPLYGSSLDGEEDRSLTNILVKAFKQMLKAL